MNILPKKSWHVRTRKNIERVQRDEAEAARSAQIELDRKLRAEQEARIRELRARASIEDPVPSSEHFNLFGEPQEHNKSSNLEHEAEERQREAASRQRAGIWNKLVRSQDVNRPWYCTQVTTTERLAKNSTNLVTSIYDPMTAIKHAEEIVRSRRHEKRSLEEAQTSRPRGWTEPSRSCNTAKECDETNLDSDSSPEILKVVKVGEGHKKKKHHKKNKKHSSKHHHHRSHKHEKHKR